MKKALLALMLCVVFVFVFFACGEDAGGTGNGNNSENGSGGFDGAGTETAPYLISNETELRALATSVNGGNNYQDKFFKLTADITLTGGAWVPIGNSSANSFQGTFNGDGKKISGVSINTPTVSTVGLFGNILSGKVHSLTVDGSIIGDRYVGGGVRGQPVEHHGSGSAVGLEGCNAVTASHLDAPGDELVPIDLQRGVFGGEDAGRGSWNWCEPRRLHES